MLARIQLGFISLVLLIGLTSCGHKETPKTDTKPPSETVKVKPVKPTPAPPSTKPSTHKVGILLPLSGPHEALGKGMLDAAEMAFFETGASSVTLLPQDTAQGAHQAALKALDEGAELLLGPIFSSEVESIKPLLNARNVSLISFSTDQSVAGNKVYVLGFLPSQQIERVVSYAKERNLSKIAAFIQDTPYGQLVDQTLKRLEAQGEIQLLGITHYSKGDLLEGNPGNVRLLEDIEHYKSKGVDALVIPEGGENLAHLLHLLSPQLSMPILGSGQWDNPQILQLAPNLKEGFFASTDPQTHQDFDKRFQTTYGHPAPRIATLAYDATALAIALADKGYTPQNLTFSQGFAGTDGIFRLTSQGLNERGLAVLEVTPSGFRTLSPSPTAF